VQQTYHQQPEQATLEERSLNVAALLGPPDLQREAEAEQERKDRIELSFDEEVYEEMRDLIA
jgi:hypothetical protein